jgi:hypothetical protein
MRLEIGLPLPATPALRLNRRAFRRTEGAEHTAIAGLGAQQRVAVATLVEELAGVGGHRFLLGKSTARADQYGLQDNSAQGLLVPAWPTSDSLLVLRSWSFDPISNLLCARLLKQGNGIRLSRRLHRSGRAAARPALPVESQPAQRPRGCPL